MEKRKEARAFTIAIPFGARWDWGLSAELNWGNFNEAHCIARGLVEILDTVILVRNRVWECLERSVSFPVTNDLEMI